MGYVENTSKEVYTKYSVEEAKESITFILVGDEEFLNSRRAYRIFRNYGFTFDYECSSIHILSKEIGSVSKHITPDGISVVVTVSKDLLNKVLEELEMVLQDLDLDLI